MAEYLDPADLVNIPDLSGCAGVGKEFAVKKMAQVARSRLVVLAQQRLFTSARDYVKAIQPMRREVGAAGLERYVIDIIGALPYMEENCAAAWDLRESILKPGTRRLRVSKAGYLYVSIPFLHMGPKASGRNAPAMGSQYTQESLRADSRAFRGDLDKSGARTMGHAVHKAAQMLGASKSKIAEDGAPKSISYGGRLAPGTGGATILRARHVTDLFAGMLREEKTYQKATQNQYMTFRTISSDPATFRSDEGGQNWTHPGITARRLVPEAKAYMEQLLAQGAFNA